MTTYRSKPVEVQAQRYRRGQPVPAGVLRDLTTHTAFLDVAGEPVIEDGDWVVRNAAGDARVLTDEAFQRLYEEVRRA